MKISQTPKLIYLEEIIGYFALKYNKEICVIFESS